MTTRTESRPRHESPDESKALAALREERAQAEHFRPWNPYGADAWVANYDLGLT